MRHRGPLAILHFPAWHEPAKAWTHRRALTRGTPHLIPPFFSRQKEQGVPSGKAKFLHNLDVGKGGRRVSFGTRRISRLPITAPLVGTAERTLAPFFHTRQNGDLARQR